MTLSWITEIHKNEVKTTKTAFYSRLNAGRLRNLSSIRDQAKNFSVSLNCPD